MAAKVSWTKEKTSTGGSSVKTIPNQIMLMSYADQKKGETPVQGNTYMGTTPQTETNTYYDQYGNPSTGYTIQGKTYTDPQGKNRIETGTITRTGDGQYWQLGADDVGVPISAQDANRIWNQNNAQLEAQREAARVQEQYKNMIDEMRAQNEALTRAQVQQGVDRLQAQIPQINRDYDEMARQAYVQRMMEQRDLPQQLAAAGITGGASESSEIALLNQYRNALNQGELARKQAIEGINNSVVDLQNTGDLDIANQGMTYAQMAIDAYNKALAQQNYLNQFNYQLGRDVVADELANRQLERALAQDEYAREQTDFERAQQEQQQRLQAAQLAMQFGDYGPMAAYLADTTGSAFTPEQIQAAYGTTQRSSSDGNRTWRPAIDTSVYEDILASGLNPYTYFTNLNYNSQQVPSLVGDYYAWLENRAPAYQPADASDPYINWLNGVGAGNVANQLITDRIDAARSALNDAQFKEWIAQQIGSFAMTSSDFESWGRQRGY